MKLEFGLLWVEDNYSPAEEDVIRRAAHVAGFELSIANSVDGRDIEDHAREQRLFHIFDLILVDLKLGDGVLGDELAGRTRNLFRSTPILFYSGSESEIQLRSRMAERKIEGVFCANRETFTDRAGEIITDYAQSLNRLSGMRGLSVQVVAEADLLVREIVAALCADGHEEYACSELNKSVSDLATKTLREFPGLEGIHSRLASRAVDSMKLFNLFRELLKRQIATLPTGEAKDQLSSLRIETRNYRKQVIDVRNVLGHSLEQRTEQGWKILNKSGYVYMTIDDFPVHRNNFLSNLRAIREIHEILVVK